MSNLSELLQRAVAHYEGLSAVDKALADEQQRRSWVRGRDPGYSVLASEVLRLRKELEGHRKPGLDSKGREKIERLKKRAYHLQNRIDNNPRRDLSHDKRELSALRWAIEKISGETFGGVDAHDAALGGKELK